MLFDQPMYALAEDGTIGIHGSGTGDFYVYDQCKYVLDTSTNANLDNCYVTENMASGVIGYCPTPYVSTDEAYTGTVDPANQPPDPVTEPPVIDDRETTASEIVQPEQSVTEPDGTVTKTNVKTIDECVQCGVWVNDAGETVVALIDSDGTVRITTENETTVIRPDGTKTVTTDKTVQSTKGQETKLTVDRENRNLTQTTTAAQPTTTAKTTTTTDYDSSGNITGTSTTKSGNAGTGADGEGEDGSTGTIKGFQPGEKGAFGELQPELDQAWADLSAAAAQIRSEITTTLNMNVSGSTASLPCPEGVEVLGQQITLCFSQFEEELDIIRLALLLGASLMAVGIVLSR